MPTSLQHTRHEHTPPTLDERLDALDGVAFEHALDQDGCATIKALLDPRQCRELRSMYAHAGLFRSRVVMARHGFGRGQYQYFAYPLPDLVAQLRRTLYPRLVPLANHWHARMGLPGRFPAEHDAFVQRCHDAGQQRPTLLLLQYGPQDYNCLHQDLYGEHVFPLQVAILLSVPGEDFTGGEFVLTEQRPRLQTRPMVMGLEQGDALVFAVHQRPVKGVRGDYRVNMRHGVSRLHSGTRHTLGVIFHDAQ